MRKSRLGSVNVKTQSEVMDDCGRNFQSVFISKSQKNSEKTRIKEGTRTTPKDLWDLMYPRKVMRLDGFLERKFEK